MPEIFMPRLSDTMEEGTLSRWLKQEGDLVHKGDAVAEIETDKAVMELEAYDEGPLIHILVAEGTTVPIGTPIAMIGTDSPATAQKPPLEQAAQAPDPSAAPPTPPQDPPAVPATTVATVSDAGEDSEVRTSPLARTLARQNGIDLADLTGSGPGGRIVRADVDAAVPTFSERAAGRSPLVDDDEEVPLSTSRRITAQRLTQSTRQTPHFYLTTIVDAEPLLAFRAQINDRLTEPGLRISINDLLIKGCATTLRTHPQVNASWDTSRILRHRRIHIGIAVATDDGLIVPVLHDADRKTLTAIAREAHGLAQDARARHVSPASISGGTFTISNLGTYGIDHFTAVINPPQAAILAVGAAQPQPIVRNGELGVGTTMALTLSIDHRVLDGAVAAAFLADLKTLLEQPFSIVL
ncbi:dihydrolipoamide acetyltransferase family protein [Streptomyces sp. B21-083]|uniref:dihydrolipoamide acetyltransferase family protein n=1 Tax=Streptomyces sp. B21-083 TaxID=3039410 RepID=UPI002FF1968F